MSIDRNAKLLKGFMKPLLHKWLLRSGTDGMSPVSWLVKALSRLTTFGIGPEYAALRETFLPEVIIGYASTLQFAGTTTSRDYLLECMELSAVIADPESDLPAVFEKTGRLGELVATFASASKALAIWTSDQKKGPGSGSKKMRELGWSRELWTVKS